jgi:hypothetical protein
MHAEQWLPRCANDLHRRGLTPGSSLAWQAAEYAMPSNSA